MGGKFSFLYVDLCFDVTKCKFNVKNSSFEMLVVFSPIFVADTKITFVYNFVAPLKNLLLLLFKFHYHGFKLLSYIFDLSFGVENLFLRNSYFCVTPKNHRLMFVSLKH